jgi:hypothetical protein
MQPNLAQEAQRIEKERKGEKEGKAICLQLLFC